MHGSGSGDTVAAGRTRTAPLYMRVLGDSWAMLAEPVRCAHSTRAIVRAHGYLRIEHGRRSLARVLARMFRLPRPNAAAETRLIVTARDDGEHWERTFDGQRLDTRQYESRQYEPRESEQSEQSELAERFGLLELRFRLDTSEGSLLYVQRRAAVLFGPVRVPIPGPLAPRVEAREDPAGPNCVSIDVRVILPGVGPLITYQGMINLEEPPA
jgi:hypothetical protein